MKPGGDFRIKKSVGSLLKHHRRHGCASHCVFTLEDLFQMLAKDNMGALFGIGYGKLNADGEGGPMKTNILESSNLNRMVSVEVARRISKDTSL